MLIFRSKTDNFYKIFLLIQILILGAVLISPLYISDETSMSLVIFMYGTFIILTGLILWSACSIKYVFYQEYLFVKGGLFKSSIDYQNITKVTETSDVFTGYRVSTSRDGLELFYQPSTHGSVKISPEEKDQFIAELKQRYPHAEFKV